LPPSTEVLAWCPRPESQYNETERKSGRPSELSETYGSRRTAGRGH
jgi:hypothetical protein